MPNSLPASPPVSPIVGAMSNSVRPTWSFIFEQTKLSLILRRTLRATPLRRPLLRRQSKIENHPTMTPNCRQGCWGVLACFIFRCVYKASPEGSTETDKEGAFNGTLRWRRLLSPSSMRIARVTCFWFWEGLIVIQMLLKLIIGLIEVAYQSRTPQLLYLLKYWLAFQRISHSKLQTSIGWYKQTI